MMRRKSLAVYILALALGLAARSGAAGSGPSYCVVDLSAGPEAAAYPVAYLDEPPQDGFNSSEYKTDKLVLKRVEPGSFEMGESPRRTVTISEPYYLGVFEVTQRQWLLVMGGDLPAETTRKDALLPVERVSYDMICGSGLGSVWPRSDEVDEGTFLARLRSRTQLNLNLPTEAQWEYACRAGGTAADLDDTADNGQMWYRQNASAVQEVGTRLPNNWGFYDMRGNLFEWCRDYRGDLAGGTDPKGAENGTERVYRGGCWNSNARICTPSTRRANASATTTYLNGFRLAGSARIVEPDPIPEIFPAAGQSEVLAALAGSADGKLAVYITSADEYGAYRNWAVRVAPDVPEGLKGIKDSPRAYLSYALDVGALLEQDLAAEAVRVSAFAPGAARAGAFDLALAIDGVTVGARATATNLGNVFSVEGSAQANGLYSAETVDFAFGRPKDGKVMISVRPRETSARQFFFKVKLLD